MDIFKNIVNNIRPVNNPDDYNSALCDIVKGKVCNLGDIILESDNYEDINNAYGIKKFDKNIFTLKDSDLYKLNDYLVILGISQKFNLRRYIDAKNAYNKIQYPTKGQYYNSIKELLNSRNLHKVRNDGNSINNNHKEINELFIRTESYDTNIFDFDIYKEYYKIEDIMADRSINTTKLIIIIIVVLFIFSFTVFSVIVIVLYFITLILQYFDNKHKNKKLSQKLIFSLYALPYYPAYFIIRKLF